jgi:hypothetical protein
MDFHEVSHAESPSNGCVVGVWADSAYRSAEIEAKLDTRINLRGQLIAPFRA